MTSDNHTYEVNVTRTRVVVSEGIVTVNATCLRDAERQITNLNPKRWRTVKDDCKTTREIIDLPF